MLAAIVEQSRAGLSELGEVKVLALVEQLQIDQVSLPGLERA